MATTTKKTINNETITLKPLVQRLKQKKQQLTARITNQKDNSTNEILKPIDPSLDYKRKNPFAISVNANKRFKSDVRPDTEDSLLDFINKTATSTSAASGSATEQTEANLKCSATASSPFALSSAALSTKFSLQPFDEIDGDYEANLLEKQKYTKHLPMDWCLKTRVRFFCLNELPSTQLKTNQAASSLTSFVRCIDAQTACNSLDISPASRFNQATFYWQHPHIPWMTLYPRNSRNNCGLVLGERERTHLAEEWDYSFRGLFQLLRSRQCAYFYLCANTFTVLFRAAGVGGRQEIHALMTPSTRGIRHALRQEGIEYTMPLKQDISNNTNELGDNEKDLTPKLDNDNTDKYCDVADNEDDEEEWLESLGVDEKEIRRMKTAHQRKVKSQQMSDDFSDMSLLLIEGVECQGFFSFLLNAKSTISSVGRLAGVPPTLLAPVAFPKATMQHLTTRSNKVRLDGNDYFSIEVKGGVILPSFLSYVFQLLKENKSTFSATVAANTSTLAFTKATQKLLEESLKKRTHEIDNDDDASAGDVFNKENLSDCGLQTCVIEDMCRTGQYAVALWERICFNKEYGYAWS